MILAKGLPLALLGQRQLYTATTEEHVPIKMLWRASFVKTVEEEPLVVLGLQHIRVLMTAQLAR